MRDKLNDYVIEIHQELKDTKKALEYLVYIVSEMDYLWRCQGATFKTLEEFQEEKEK